MTKDLKNTWAYKIGKSLGKSGTGKSVSWWKGILNWTKLLRGGK